METAIKEIAQRVKGLREILEISEEAMAERTEVTVEQYRLYESGECDFSFTFLYNCAQTFGVDLVELVTGEKPRLSFYTVVRKGQGLPIKRREGLIYHHLAYRIKDKLAEPFLVTIPYQTEEEGKPLHLSRHLGQELDYVLKGSFKIQLDEHVEILHEGDSIYYDSGHAHGVAATNGEDCVILACVIKDPNEGEE